MARYTLFLMALLAEDDLTIAISRRDLTELLGTAMRSTTEFLRSLIANGDLVVERKEAGWHPRLYRIVPAT